MNTIEWEAEQRDKRKRALKNHTKEVVICKLSKQVRQLANKVREQEDQLKEKASTEVPTQVTISSLPASPSLKIGPLPKYLPMTPKPSCTKCATITLGLDTFVEVTNTENKSTPIAACPAKMPDQYTNSATPSLSNFMFPNTQNRYHRPLSYITPVTYSMNSNTLPTTSNSRPIRELSQYATWTTSTDLMVPRMNEYISSIPNTYAKEIKKNHKPPTTAEWKENPVKYLNDRSDYYWKSLLKTIQYQDKRKDKFFIRSTEDNLVYRLKIFRDRSVKIYLDQKWETLRDSNTN